MTATAMNESEYAQYTGWIRCFRDECAEMLADMNVTLSIFLECRVPRLAPKRIQWLYPFEDDALASHVDAACAELSKEYGTSSAVSALKLRFLHFQLDIPDGAPKDAWQTIGNAIWDRVENWRLEEYGENVPADHLRIRDRVLACVDQLMWQIARVHEKMGFVA